MKELKRYFATSELVCPHVLARDGEKSWRQFTTDALKVLLILRTEVLNTPLTCNVGAHTQRGLRCNLCELVKSATDGGRVYMTPHNGRGFDLSSKYDAETMRRKIEAAADKFPCPVRVEDGVTWLHIDVVDEMNGKKVYRFKA